MASEENLTEEEMNLGRTEGLYLTPLGSPMPRKSSAELRGRAVPDVARGGGREQWSTSLDHTFYGMKKKIYDLDPTLKGPRGGFWSPPGPFFFNYDPIGPTTKNLDFKNHI
jgi:hypothetical protein